MKKLILIAILSFLTGCSDDSFTDSKKVSLGLEVYSNMCSNCHGSLEQSSFIMDKPTKIRIISAVTYGAGVMSPFQDALSTEEIEAVAYYILSKYK